MTTKQTKNVYLTIEYVIEKLYNEFVYSSRDRLCYLTVLRLLDEETFRWYLSDPKGAYMFFCNDTRPSELVNE